MIIALAGNQNCGKTTLFNQLTGSNQHVGNFPGVTVERKEGEVKGHKNLTIVDLPGIYSLSPYTSEEIVSRDFLLSGKIDCVLNIVDATNIERNLYLSMQLIELNIPMVMALNMMDEVKSNGNNIDINRFSRHIGVPVVPISASKNEGINELIDVLAKTATEKIGPKRQDFCQGATHRAIHAIAHLIEDHAQKYGVPSRFAATKLIAGDAPMLEKLKLSENEKDMLEHTVIEMESELDTDREAALADMRYNYIERICSITVHKQNIETKEQKRSLKIDKILTNKYLGIPVFLLIMFAIFSLTFGVIGKFLNDAMSFGIDNLSKAADKALTNLDINPILHSLIIDGVFTGIGSILSFLPTIVVLFFFLSILEDTGYMARVAFIMDKALRHIGLSGRSFVPMIIGFGCSVPAIMATRTLASERDRKITIMLVPFMSCSAKLPIYSLFAMAFFPNNVPVVMISLYVFGMIIGVLLAAILNLTVFRGKPVPFVMELPNYRMPSLKSVLMMIWDKAKDFLQRAFTVIFLATIVIWFLQNFDLKFNPVEDSSLSMLAGIGKFIQPVFAPLGFSDWRAPTALISGFTAKEAVVSTLAVLSNTSTQMLTHALSTQFSAFSAIAFLVFTLLYTPCVAAITTVKNELRSRKAAAVMVAYQTIIAWCVAFLVYHVCLIFA